MGRLLRDWMGWIPWGSRGALGVSLLLLFPSASSEVPLGGALRLSTTPGSFRVTLTSGEVLAGKPLGKARRGILSFQLLEGGKARALPVREIRRLEPLPPVRVVLPGKKRRFPEKERDARRWIRLLYASRGAVRDRGEEGLVALGRSVRPLLYKLVWTAPPEVSFRASRALKRIEALPWGPRGNPLQRRAWKGAE